MLTVVWVRLVFAFALICGKDLIRHYPSSLAAPSLPATTDGRLPRRLPRPALSRPRRGAAAQRRLLPSFNPTACTNPHTVGRRHPK